MLDLSGNIYCEQSEHEGKAGAPTTVGRSLMLLEAATTPSGGRRSPINCFPEKKTFKIKTYFPM